MKYIPTLFAIPVGLFGGALVAYCTFAPVYLIYAALSPLDPSAECVRASGLAWGSIFFGAVAGSILAPKLVRHRLDA